MPCNQGWDCFASWMMSFREPRALLEAHRHAQVIRQQIQHRPLIVVFDSLLVTLSHHVEAFAGIERGLIELQNFALSLCPSLMFVTFGFSKCTP